MRTASPWWASLILWVGLLFIFLGERLLSTLSSARVIFTGVGLVAVIGIFLARAWTWSATKGARKRIERTFLVSHLFTVLALVLYALTTSWGPESLQSPKAQGALTVLWAIMIAASVIPTIFAEIALGTALRDKFDVQTQDDREESAVDYFRTRDLSWSGLALAFALALMMVTCRVAKERNVQKDVSYFKTSAAGESTQNIVRSFTEPVRVHMFFPPNNEVTEQVKSYFEQLQDSTGKVELTVHDRLADAELAAKYKVTKDGVIVLAKGTGDKEKTATHEIPESELKDADKMRRSASLRTLDSKINSALLKIAREKRKVYLTVGHGEANDPESIPSELRGRIDSKTTKLKQRLGELNYEVKELGLIDLAKDVPDDATVVLVLAPTSPFQDAEWAALDRYLQKGGRLMVALDPKSSPELGALQGRLGVKMVPGHLTDDVAYLPQRGSPADKRIAITTQFSAHAATTALSRAVDKGLVLIDAGALEDAPFTDAKNAAKKTFTIRSMDSSWLDLNENFSYDAAGGEKKQKWNIAAAIEGPKVGDKDGFRAVVFSDIDLFVDIAIGNAMGQRALVMISGPLLDDTIKWLGGEEVYSGEIVSEEDKAIEHTKNEDAVWFLLTVIGVPLIVLGLGLGGTLYARRRRAATKTEVTP
ncbi:MAG TPA: Gldg family protein [Kofleriaceae bacterium]|nr:Gldg family protein [Kofleriaceae bacterium]